MARIHISNDLSGRIIVSFPYVSLLLGHSHNKTTEIYTHVSTNSLGKIRSPLDNLTLEGGNIDKI
jgi:integrase